MTILDELGRNSAWANGYVKPPASATPKTDRRLSAATPFAIEPEWISRLAGSAARQLGSGGFTIHPRTGNKPTTGYQVAEVGATEFEDAGGLDALSETELSQVLQPMITRALFGHRDRYLGHPEVCLGGWIETGKLWLEPSDGVATLDAARLLGVARNQRTVWDNTNCVSVPIGGTHAVGAQATTA